MNIRKNYKYIVTILMFLLALIFSVNLYNFNILPDQYFKNIIILLIILLTIGTIMLFIKSKLTKIITIILYLPLILISIYGNYFINYINNYLDYNLNNANNNYKITYNILSKKSYKESDLQNKTIYYYKNALEIDEYLNILKEKYNIKAISVDENAKLLNKDLFIMDKESFDIESIYGSLKNNNYKIVSSYLIDYKDEVYQNDDYRKNIYNIYIGGYDFSGSRIDYNSLITINLDTNKVLITNFPRDYYINDDTLATMGVYGISSNIKAIEELFDLKIDYYLMADGIALMNIVDTLGKIEYCSDIEYTTTHALVLGSYIGSEFPHLDVKVGCQMLNGIETLTVSREREKLPNKDIDRINNNIKIIDAIINDIKEIRSISKYKEISEAIVDTYETNITDDFVRLFIKNSFNSKWDTKNIIIEGEMIGKKCKLSGTYKTVMIPSKNDINIAKNEIKKINS